MILFLIIDSIILQTTKQKQNAQSEMYDYDFKTK